MAAFFRREYPILLVVTFLWGSGHTAAKLALRELEVGHLALLRPAFACLVLLLLVAASGRVGRLPVELRASPGLLLVLGLLGYAGAGGTTVLALNLLPAGITSLLAATSPLMAVLAGLLARQGVRPLQAFGTLLGFLGVLVLSSGGLATTQGLQPLALLGVPLALGSAACWAGYTTLARRLAGRDPLVTTALSSALGTAAVALVAVPTQDWSRLATASWLVFAATAWAGGIALGCAYAAWTFVLRRLPPAAVLPFNYLTPVFSLGIASLVLAEAITLPVVLGAVCVMAGVALSQLRDLRLLRRASPVRVTSA